jgi:hypothetical protein
MYNRKTGQRVSYKWRYDPAEERLLATDSLFIDNQKVEQFISDTLLVELIDSSLCYGGFRASMRLKFYDNQSSIKGIELKSFCFNPKRKKNKPKLHTLEAVFYREFITPLKAPR